MLFLHLAYLPKTSSSLCAPHSAHCDIMSQVFLILNLNGRSTLFLIYYVNADLDPEILGLFNPVCYFLTRAGSQVYLIPLYIIDVPASLGGDLINCCDSNLSQSGRPLLLRSHQPVKTQFYPNPLNAYCDRCCSVSGLESNERSGRLEWRVNPVPITLSRVEVTINRTCDQDRTPQTCQNGSLACIEERLWEKPGKQCELDESAENGVECQRQASS